MGKIKWTFEMLQTEALKYDRRIDFQKESKSAYSIAQRRGILDQVCSHMELQVKNWSDEMLHVIALKYNSRNDFKRKNPNAYCIAHRRDIIDHICSHMISSRTHADRMIYCCVFEDDTVYVGLTCDFNSRKSSHLSTKIDNNSAIRKYLDSGVQIKEWRKLTDYLPEKEAAEKERYVIKEFMDSKFKILNKSNGGEL